MVNEVHNIFKCILTARIDVNLLQLTHMASIIQAGKSQMHLKYVHYYGNEASNAILKARGIISDDQQDTRLLSKPKECPNCSELNDPLGKFCIKCKMVLRYEGYAEALEAAKKKDQDIQHIKLQLQS